MIICLAKLWLYKYIKNPKELLYNYINGPRIKKRNRVLLIPYHTVSVFQSILSPNTVSDFIHSSTASRSSFFPFLSVSTCLDIRHAVQESKFPAEMKTLSQGPLPTLYTVSNLKNSSHQRLTYY